MTDWKLAVGNEPLEKASAFKGDGLSPGSLYKMAKRNLIPYYRVGPKQTGVRFRRSEVLAALRRPAVMEVKE